LLVKSFFLLLNAAFAMAILDLIRSVKRPVTLSQSLITTRTYKQLRSLHTNIFSCLGVKQLFIYNTSWMHKEPLCPLRSPAMLKHIKKYFVQTDGIHGLTFGNNASKRM
jgi:hypothetical protein